MGIFNFFKKWFSSKPEPVELPEDISEGIALEKYPNISKRARNKKGRFVADDKSTPNINEAWVSGKSRKKTKK